ncbi:snRNA-activating protein complex, subunit 3 [Syncephalis fuscata]|nr:snRNA-activating protein complex, subunit 3 [Syncephalis fuscata]
MANSNAFVTIITVTLFNPEKQHARSEEVEILSSQTVADLLSHIGCHTPARTAESEQILTGVCCIGDNVYVDVTDKPSVEYGQRLSRSLKEDPYTFIVPTTAVLATKFEDIDIVLGQQNLLSHGGHCRHAFMFKNVRCVQLAQAKDKSLFPRTIFRGRINRVKCHMCTIYPAERVILDDVHCGDTPVMLCICCYSMFLEDADGKLLREVKEVPYNTKQMEFDEACDEAGGM